MSFHPALEAAICVNLGTSFSLSRVLGLGVVVYPGLCRSSSVGCYCYCYCRPVTFLFFIFLFSKTAKLYKTKEFPILMLDELFKRVCLLM